MLRQKLHVIHQPLVCQRLSVILALIPAQLHSAFKVKLSNLSATTQASTIQQTQFIVSKLQLLLIVTQLAHVPPLLLQMTFLGKQLQLQFTQQVAISFFLNFQIIQPARHLAIQS